MLFTMTRNECLVHRFHRFMSLFMLLFVMLLCSVILVFLPSSPEENCDSIVGGSNQSDTEPSFLRASSQAPTPPQRLSNDNPWQDFEACRGGYSFRGQLNFSRVCDVHHVLTWVDLLSIETEAKAYEETYQNYYETLNCSNRGTPLAVAIVPSMIEDYTPEEYAAIVIDSWGVGVPAECFDDADKENHGILILVSIREKRAFIFGGDDVLPDSRRFSQILNYMKPLMRKGEFHHAITTAIQALSDVMRQVAAEEHGDVFIKQEPPNNHKQMAYYKHHGKKGPYILLYVAIAMSIAGSGCYCCRGANLKRILQQQLERFDMVRAWALQGKYQSTQCPICLEDFHGETQPNNPTATGGERKPLMQGKRWCNRFVGSDGLPLKLLPCGHLFHTTCWETWVESCRLSALTCPVCRRALDDPSKAGNNNSQPRLERTARRSLSLSRHNRLRQWPPPSHYGAGTTQAPQAAPPPARINYNNPDRLPQLQSPTSYGSAIERRIQELEESEEIFSWYDDLYTNSSTEESVTEFVEEEEEE